MRSGPSPKAGKTTARHLAAMRAARRYLARDRRALLEFHTIGATGRRADLEDAEGKDCVAELDRIIARLDEFIIYYGGQHK